MVKKIIFVSLLCLSCLPLARAEAPSFNKETPPEMIVTKEEISKITLSDLIGAPVPSVPTQPEVMDSVKAPVERSSETVTNAVKK